MSKTSSISLTINGKLHSITADPDRTLLSIIRDDLDMTGTHYGCGEGQCGACTVLIDGRPTRSCLVRAASVAGQRISITTIEGLEKAGKLHPVQQAFIDEDALQCGYCTSGMILAAVALLQRTPHPSDEEIHRGMQGNICRCGTYRRILRAVKKAVRAEGGQQ